MGTSVLQFQVQNEMHYSHLAVNRSEKCDAIQDDLDIEPATDLKIRFHIFNNIITRRIFRVLKPSGTISVISLDTAASNEKVVCARTLSMGTKLSLFTGNWWARATISLDANYRVKGYVPTSQFRLSISSFHSLFYLVSLAKFHTSCSWTSTSLRLRHSQ